MLHTDQTQGTVIQQLETHVISQEIQLQKANFRLWLLCNLLKVLWKPKRYQRIISQVFKQSEEVDVSNFDINEIISDIENK